MPDCTSGTLTATGGQHATITAPATRGITSVHPGYSAAILTGAGVFIMVPGDGIHHGTGTGIIRGMLRTGTPGTALTGGTHPTTGIGTRLTAGTGHSDSVRITLSPTIIST